MKRFFCWLLAGFLLLNAGCSAGEETEEPLPETMVAEAEKETVPTNTTVTEETEPAGVIFLTVSEIDLTLVGDQENIYAGTVPAEEVTWTSSDETIIRVQNGEIQAVGVGSAAVTAEYGDQKISCRAGCLAESREELLALGENVYRKPKRLPPVLPEGTSFYENAALLGDSICYGLFKNETRTGELGHPLFLARGGLSIMGLVKHVKEVVYQGKPIPIADAVQASGVDRVFILLGQNDLDFMGAEEVMEYLKTMIGDIREKNPQVILVIQSCIPKLTKDIRFNERNEKVEYYNTLVQQYAGENGLEYMELSPYVEDHVHSMARIYCLDELHLNPEGCRIWMEALKAYTYLKSLQS